MDDPGRYKQVIIEGTRHLLYGGFTACGVKTIARAVESSLASRLPAGIKTKDRRAMRRPLLPSLLTRESGGRGLRELRAGVRHGPECNT